MRIAMTGNVFPFGEGKAYGAERVIYYLIRGLRALGHEIVLFANRQHTLPAGLVEAHIPVPHAYEWKIDESAKAAAEYEDRIGKRFDVYQCNYFGGIWDPNTVVRWNYAELAWCSWCHTAKHLGKQSFNTISVSKLMHDDMAEKLMPSTMIHYGIPVEDYVLGASGGYLVWAGKLEGGKGVEWAIEVARRSKRKLVVIGPPYNPGYFRTVMPYLDDKQVIWLRGCSDTVKREVLRNAHAFLSPNVANWTEQFGIVNIEALASGVPLIAWTHKSRRSGVWTDAVVTPSVNGFYVEYEDSHGKEFDEVAERVAQLVNDEVPKLDREAIKWNADGQWSNHVMATRYTWFYEQIQGGARHASLKVPF